MWIYSSQSPAHRLIARVIPFLDWLFQLRLATHSGQGPRFVNRDGTTYRGVMAGIMLGANLPILYPFFYPLSWLRFLPWGRSREPIQSTPTESPQCFVGWLVLWLLLYLIFVAVINFHSPLRVDEGLLRFWDLPWFFGLMCLMAGAYHRSMVGALNTAER